MPTRSQGNLCVHTVRLAVSGKKAAHHSLSPSSRCRSRPLRLLLAFGYLSSRFPLSIQSSTYTPFVLVFACTAEAERVCVCVCVRERSHSLVEHTL